MSNRVKQMAAALARPGNSHSLEFSESETVDVPVLIPADADFTFSAWVKIPATADAAADETDDAVYGQNSGSDDRLTIYVVTDFGTATKEIRVWSSALGELLVGTDVRGDGWFLLTITREGDVWKLYKGVTEVASNTVAGSLGAASDARLCAAATATGTVAFWYEGWLNHVRIYTRALSPAEIGKLVVGVSISRFALAAHWPLNEGSGTTANDHSGNGNIGTINGAIYSTDKPF